MGRRRIALACAVGFVVLAVTLIMIANIHTVAASPQGSDRPTVPVLVTNNATQPVPTQSVEAATVIVFSGSILGSTPTFDVSAYRKIRVSVASSFAGGGRATIFNVDGSHRITLASIASPAAGGPGTAVIDLPGRTIQVEGFNLNGTTLDELLIDGR